ncbi:sulfatase family protein [Paenibacillus planticolens]|uniref:Sulfatase-like hydrolase/transferase n=1 Tax=Paenibacillus planticolens TaxID=2654976 RepID=A0ABX1ZXG6_9BACL|nr:sulfatase-like hydrolase/transferase [Paenibacillus planticolens]NOV04735.1 sulfatase-like hydrolase/transferase [Paenibacillus planticolens]
MNEGMGISVNKKEKPNIVLITTDTQRCDTLRCMGSPFAISPHLDRLASEGVLFTNAHTASPVCSPARSSLMTGLHAPIHGCIENGIDRKSGHLTFPDLLQEQGYVNIMVGKTHFGEHPASFDIVREIKGEKSAASVDDSYAKFINSYGLPRSSAGPRSMPDHLHMDAFLINATIEEIEACRQAENGPFFAFCSLLSPHSPLDPPGHWATLFDSTPLPPIDYKPGDVENLPLHTRRLLGFIGNEAELEASLNTPEALQAMEHKRRLYYGMTAFIDAQIGRLLEYLDQTGLRENTLILFTSDHGTQLFDHGFDDKHNYLDATWRIPFIMSMPGTLPCGKVCDFATWTDIAATILAAGGTYSRYVQGFDLFTPLIQGLDSPRRCAVGTLYKSAAVATQRWKLEYYFEEQTGMMYDRLNDPSERSNLYNDPQYDSVKQELLVALLTWRADLSDLQLMEESQQVGGPVAQRIKPYSLAKSGWEVERRLGAKAEAIDLLFEV